LSTAIAVLTTLAIVASGAALLAVQNGQAAARERFDQAGIEYLGPDRGVEDSLSFRDPTGSVWSCTARS
jgi:hypothetical protein